MPKFRVPVFCVAILMLGYLTTVAHAADAHLMQVAIASAHEDTPQQAQTDRNEAQRDPNIVALMKDASAERLRGNIDKLVSFGTRNTISANSVELARRDKGIVAAREWIRSEFERISKDCGGCLEVKVDLYTQPPDGKRVTMPTDIGNVYAVLRGANQESAKRSYIIGGHYDSRATDVTNPTVDAPGANDDGSGVAATIEAARVLSKHKFPATIIFAAFAGEEQGLYGSRHFAQLARDQQWGVNAVLSNDTVGGDRSPGQQSLIRIFSEGIALNATEAELKQLRSVGGENDSTSRELARYIREIWRTYQPGVEARMIFRPDRYLRGGDHTSFNQLGMAAVRLTEWRENYDHQHQNVRNENGIEYGDLPKFVDFEYLANVARLNIATLASLASAPAQPVNVRLETKELTNDSTLAWAAGPGGQVGGYEVVWRATTSPEWEHAQSAGNATRVTIKESKDNVIFGVRSVDAQGHRSLAVVPVAER